MQREENLFALMIPMTQTFASELKNTSRKSRYGTPGETIRARKLDENYHFESRAPTKSVWIV